MSKRPGILLWSLITCNLAMMMLAIAINLLPVFSPPSRSIWARGRLCQPNNWVASEPSLSPVWLAVSW